MWALTLASETMGQGIHIPVLDSWAVLQLIVGGLQHFYPPGKLSEGTVLLTGSVLLLAEVDHNKQPEA